MNPRRLLRASKVQPLKALEKAPAFSGPSQTTGSAVHDHNRHLHIKPPISANKSETTPVCKAVIEKALFTGLSPGCRFQLTAIFAPNHPIIATAAPEISKATISVKKNLSISPVHIGRISLFKLCSFCLLIAS